MTTEAKSYEGGCLCGQTRLRAQGPAAHLCFCHCRSCRLASGAPSVAWGTFARAGFAFAKGQPARHRSSADVWRTFCPGCGTSLTYEHARRPQEIDVALVCLDEAEALRPECHIWTADKLPWVHLGDGLPQHADWKKPE